MKEKDGFGRHPNTNQLQTLEGQLSSPNRKNIQTLKSQSPYENSWAWSFGVEQSTLEKPNE
jgi:hypothetical protein